MKKAKWLSEEALQIAKKRKDTKGKGEKERYSHLNAEFQEQQGEIRKPFQANNTQKRGKQQNGKDQRSLRENQGCQGSISCQVGHNEGQASMGLTEAEDVKKRRQEYTEELGKRDLRGPDNGCGVITHLEPDILECQVK